MSQLLTIYLRKLKISSLERKIPNISEENAEFIKDLIREKNPRHILEIGTANGYSTLQFATAVSEKSDITTIEQAWNAHIEAIEHFKNCKVKNIHAIYWDAKLVIPSLADGFFDFIYIDAMKREYLDYLLLALPKMTTDALIVIDDVEKYRDKMENLYTYLDENKIKYTLEKTDADDSIMIIKKTNIWNHSYHD
jgi:predicted O-methyltransferase YrrM